MCVVFSRWLSFLFAIYFELQFDLLRRMLEPHTDIHCHSIGHPIVLSFKLFCDYLLVERQFDHDRVISANVGTPHSLPFDWTPNCWSFKLLYLSVDERVVSADDRGSVIYRHSTGDRSIISFMPCESWCFDSINRVVSADDRGSVIYPHSTGDRSILSFMTCYCFRVLDNRD
jgi:hypothetical protein